VPLPILKKEFHNKKQWVADISNIAGDRPVVFTNAYQRPSVYIFYSGNWHILLITLITAKHNSTFGTLRTGSWEGSSLCPHFFSDYYKKNLTAQRLSNGIQFLQGFLRFPVASA